MRRLSRPAQVVLEGGRLLRVSWLSGGADGGSGPWSPRPGGAAGRLPGGGRANRSPSGGRVVRTVDEWRVAGRWWGAEMRRDYYLLELEGGVLVELYREGERWCVTGISD